MKVVLARASAAGLVDELERDRRAAMANRDVDQLAGDDLDVGVDDRIGGDRHGRREDCRFARIDGAFTPSRADGVEISRDDVIGAFGQSDDVACLALGVDELAEGIAVLGHVDGERQLGRVDRRVGERAFDPQCARGQGKPLGVNLGAERHALGGAGQPESDVHDVIAGGMVRVGCARLEFDDQRMGAVRIGVCGEHPPAHAASQRGAAAVQDRGEAQRRLGGFGCRRLKRLRRRRARPARTKPPQSAKTLSIPPRIAESGRRQSNALKPLARLVTPQ